jgi:hypothetical protein
MLHPEHFCSSKEAASGSRPFLCCLIQTAHAWPLSDSSLPPLLLPLLPWLPHFQLQEIKAARGLTVDDGTLAPDKPLAEILAERKKAKQDAFDAQWKQMKTGTEAACLGRRVCQSVSQSAGACSPAMHCAGVVGP